MPQIIWYTLWPDWNLTCLECTQKLILLITTPPRSHIFSLQFVSVCVSVCVYQWTKFQPNRCTDLDAVFAKWLLTALAQTLLKLVTLWDVCVLWMLLVYSWKYAVSKIRTSEYYGYKSNALIDQVSRNIGIYDKKRPLNNLKITVSQN